MFLRHDLSIATHSQPAHSPHMGREETAEEVLRNAADALEQAELALVHAHQRLIGMSRLRQALHAGVQSGGDYFQALDQENAQLVKCRDLKRAIDHLRKEYDKYAYILAPGADVPLDPAH